MATKDRVCTTLFSLLTVYHPFAIGYVTSTRSQIQQSNTLLIYNMDDRLRIWKLSIERNILIKEA